MAPKRASRSKSAKTDKLFTKQALRSATDMYDELRHGALGGLRLGLLHGRQSADEKEITMARFKRGEIDAVWERLKQQWQRRYGLVEA